MENKKNNPFDGFARRKDFLVCIDSDGCAMDTMDCKHIRCFGPCMVSEWNLEQWKDEILHRWNQVNLYSLTRGINRFKALAVVLEEISGKYEIIEDVESLIRWTHESDELSNASLEREAREKGSICLEKALHWSKEVNAEIEKLPDSLKIPFPGVKNGISMIHQYADVAIVSSANPDAVEKEWTQHGLLENVDVMLAQNAGSKASCIAALLKYGYETHHVIMVGDAPGDRQAAEKNGVFYYPVLVKHEEESWSQIKEALDRLISGALTSEYQKQLNEAFEKNLNS